MKRFFWATVALALLFVRGWAIESYNKLPMFGQTFQKWSVTNVNYVSLNVYQKTTGDSVGYTGGSAIQCNSQEELDTKIQNIVAYYANAWINSGEYLSDRSLYTYVTVGHYDDLPLEGWFFSTQTMSANAELKVIDGRVVNTTIPLKPENEIGFRLEVKAKSAAIKVAGQLIPEGVRVGTGDDEGAIFIKTNLPLGAEITINFIDGTSLSYDAEGNLQGDLTPRLEIRIADGAPLIEVKGLMPNQTVELEYSTDMIHWYPYPGKVRAIRPATLPPEEQKFFRIKDQ